MKIIDINFNEIDNANQIYKDVDDVLTGVIDYLKLHIRNEKILTGILKDIDDIIIQIVPDDEFSLKTPNGSIKKQKISSNVGALRANMEVSFENNDLKVIPGVVLRPNFNKHQLIHELLHALSTKQHNKFDEEGILYTKIGTRVDYFDKNLKYHNKEDNPSSEGLNEGITEYLTSLIDGFTGNYPSLVAIASLFMVSNYNLLDAYFSNDLDALEKFYSDLEERQSIITGDDLRKLNSKEEDINLVAKIIAGAIKYNESYNCKIDVGGTLNYLDNYDMLDYGTWSDLVSNELKENISLQ